MKPTLDQLLDEPALAFTPVLGVIDVEKVAAAIAGIGYSYRDEVDPACFAIFSDPASRDACRDERRADPTSNFPFVPRVTARPNVVILFPEADQEDLRALSAQFIEWLQSNYECRIENEFGIDMSDPAAYTSDEPESPESTS